MRIPVKSEADALRFAYGSAVLIGLSIALGALVTPLVGVALFAGGVLGWVAYDISARDKDKRETLREAAAAAPPHEPGDQPRVLVISNETLVGRELRDELLRRGEPRPELRVVAPVLPSRAHYIASDIDRELAEARRRLDQTLEWAHTEGFDAAGRVGDDTPPMTAIEDELRRFRADELIISTHPPGRSNWLESNLVDTARAQLDIPVSHVIVDLSRQHVEIA